MTKTVALEKCDSYDETLVYQGIKKMMELVPPPDVKGKTVLLKPNILYPKKPDLAVCTHPVVVGAAVRCFVELGAAKVLVGESPAATGSTSAAKITGMYNQVVNNGGQWADFSDKVTVKTDKANLKHSFDFAKQIEEADLVVSVSKLKSHQLMSYTGAMKNLFGLVIGLEKSQTHFLYPKKEDFAAYLTDLNLAANPGYAIMDAIVGMEGPGGPGSGDPVKLGFLAASDNILALDHICSTAVGYYPDEIKNLKDALDRKIWLNSWDEVKTAGVPFEQIKYPKFKAVHDISSSETLQKMMPAWVAKLAGLIFERKPYFMNDKCIRCGKCLEICPPKALVFKEDKSKFGKQVDINRKECIRCYCCHETCPADAIKLKH
ncbi:MAG: DUF362 domain-containing protein [Treponema sp.]|nr:DUF362 domain-containing protein [Treponema sp.]